MENAIKGIKKALRANPKSAETSKGNVRLPIVFVNKGKTKTTVKAVFPCDFYTEQQAQSLLKDVVQVARQQAGDQFQYGYLMPEFYWGLHCRAYIVRLLFLHN